VFKFNLIDEDWIPCLMPDGRKREMSLKETLIEAQNIAEIVANSPLVTIAIYRLLIAILHRNFGTENEYEWQTLWEAKHFNKIKTNEYLDYWYNRFDLFNEKYPFYQSSNIPVSYTDSKGKLKSYAKSIVNLFHECATGNNATLFDHSTEDNIKSVLPPEAARILITSQAFAVGGLLTYEANQDPKLFKSADNAPLVKGAVTLVKGKNLFQTLMMNLHRYSFDNKEPFEMEPDDAPHWERNSVTCAVDRKPKGYIDLLTWQSRRIKLIPENDEKGNIIIKQVVIMKGNQFPDGYSLHGKEPMLAFRKIQKPTKGQEPWIPVSFHKERVIWRDSLSLFQSVTDDRDRPKILDWLGDLAIQEILPQSATYDLELMGISTDRAIIFLWRHERLPLPLMYLENKNLIDRLKDALGLAEDIGKALENAVWNFAKLNIAPEADKLNENQKKDIESIVDSLSPTRPYWAALGLYFNRLVADLANDLSPDGEYGTKVMPLWSQEVRRSAWLAFREATGSFDRSGRILKAVTIAEDSFNYRMNSIMKEFLIPYPELFNKEVKA
jgi:CRISPR system Cascade subunit CasA